MSDTVIIGGLLHADTQYGLPAGSEHNIGGTLRARLSAKMGASALLLLSFATLASAQCEPWCTEPCTVLNGNVELECPDCDPQSNGCYPGAEGYSSWEDRNVAFHDSNNAVATADEEDLLYPGCDTLRCKRVRQKRRIERENAEHQEGGRLQALSAPSDSPLPPRRVPKKRSITRTGATGGAPRFRAPRHDGATAGGEKVECELQRITFPEVQKLSLEERQALFEKPTVITGMIDGWLAHRNWTGALLAVWFLPGLRPCLCSCFRNCHPSAARLLPPGPLNPCGALSADAIPSLRAHAVQIRAPSRRASATTACSPSGFASDGTWQRSSACRWTAVPR